MEKENSIVIPNPQQIVYKLDIYKGDIQSSNLLRFKKTAGPARQSLEAIPSGVLEDVVPIINRREGFTMAFISQHLGVSSKSLSKYIKEKGFIWNIETRGYLSTDQYDLYKAVKLEKKLLGQGKVSKPRESKKLSIQVSRLVFNIIEIKKCLSSKATEDIISKLVVDSATPDELRIAKNASLQIKYKVIQDDSSTEVKEED